MNNITSKHYFNRFQNRKETVENGKYLEQQKNETSGVCWKNR